VQVLKYTAGHINYGGRVTDDWDRRCMMNVLDDYYREEVLEQTHKFDMRGIYHQLDPTSGATVSGFSHIVFQ
jgi:dynein heavy chain